MMARIGTSAHKPDLKANAQRSPDSLHEPAGQLLRSNLAEGRFLSCFRSRRALRIVTQVRRRAQAFTLIELICTLLILSSLATVAVPNFVSMTGAAYHSQVAATAGAFESATKLANLVCFVRSWANRDNLPGYGTGTIDFNSACYPTDTSGNANTIGSNATRCMRVWSGVLVAYPTITTAASGADFRATAASNVCTFRYLLDASTTRRFTYNSLTGGVTVLNP
jgi:prepilin-type N-terminal cleavage/methylation domain-containing protein